MTFNYDLGSATALTVTRSKVRFEIGDTDFHVDGPKPNGDSYTDAEIDYFLDNEGDHTMRAAAAGLENLARLWARVPDTKLGPHGESSSQVAKAYAEQSLMLRGQFGFGNTDEAIGGFSVAILPTNPDDTSGDFSI